MSMSKAKAENRPLPKKFYSGAGIARSDEGGFQVQLDGRPLRTPGGHPLGSPVEALANAMATEWDNQDTVIDPHLMPLTRLAHVAIDRMGEVREAASEEIVRFASTDLLSYRSEEPALAERQREVWDPYLDWVAQAMDAPLHKAETVMPIEQPEASLEAIRNRALALDDWRLTGLVSAIPILGSAVLGFALLEAEATGDEVFTASRLDEDAQAERWGEDAEAAEAAQNRKRDLLAVELMFRALDEG